MSLFAECRYNCGERRQDTYDVFLLNPGRSKNTRGQAGRQARQNEMALGLGLLGERRFTRRVGSYFPPAWLRPAWIVGLQVWLALAVFCVLHTLCDTGG